ncbi:MAG: RNA methyltransferase [Chitinophagales bacterium]|nr:RNA methyltransferase [Chitinophagales bacterium]
MRKLSMDELNRLSTNEFKIVKKLPIVVIIDNVRSGLNVGSVFRTSDAFLVKEIHICGYAPRPPHRDVLKSALGATDSVDWKSYESTSESIHELKQQGYKIFAVEQATPSISLHEFKVQEGEKIALIFGNEVSGVSDEALDLVDACIEVPQWGTKHSLNISVCAGIVLWEFVKKMKI